MGLRLFAEGLRGNQPWNLAVQSLPTATLFLFHSCIVSTPEGIHARGLIHPQRPLHSKSLFCGTFSIVYFSIN